MLNYGNIYKGQGFYAIVLYDLAPPLTSSSPSPVSKLDRRHTGRPRKRDHMLTGKGGKGWRRSQSYDSEKAWSSINHSILSGYKPSFRVGSGSASKRCRSTTQFVTARDNTLKWSLINIFLFAEFLSWTGRKSCRKMTNQVSLQCGKALAGPFERV